MTNPFDSEKEKNIKSAEPRSLMESAGYIISAAILLVVIVVMTTDIRNITFQNAADLSLSLFVLMFCSYGMYVSMYANGIISGEKLAAYISITTEYNKVRDEIVAGDNQKQLNAFCRAYVEEERKARIESVILVSGISMERYEALRFKTRAQMIAEGLSGSQIRCVRAANRVRPIKLTPEMLCKQGKVPIKRGVMHMQPAVRRKWDYVKKFITTALTSGAIGFITFEVFADPSWATVCSVAFKVLMVAITGYSGYRRGYDNIATDTVLFTQDQIDLLRQFQSWKKREDGKEISAGKASA